ncbi:MAG: hypothetical protein EXR81_06165 [Gammaproteobacteria bacterium]|nr:hypothetical protein [Gammaproteobacteria bacterium]
MYKSIWQHKASWLIVMSLVTVMWLCTFLGASINSGVFVLLFFSAASLCGFLVTLFEQTSDQKTPLIIASLGIFICATMLTILYFQRMSDKPLHESVSLLIYGISGGVALYLYQKNVFHFSKKTQANPTQVLAVRYWMLFFIGFILMPKDSFSALTNLHALSYILVIAVTSLIIPIYFSQKAIVTLGPEKYSILCGYIPALTYAFQWIASGHMHGEVLLFNILTCFFIGFPYIWKLTQAAKTGVK